ncbi:MAG TPA: hypothetical protein VFZ63_00315 [Jiangellaceae bacterium]
MTVTDVVGLEPKTLTAIAAEQPTNGGPPDEPSRGGWEHDLRKRSWEIHAQVVIDHLRGLAARIKNGTSDGTPQSIALSQVNYQLKVAELYLERPARPWTWLRGTRLEGTWCHIHNADVALIELLDTDELKARCPQILTLAETYLKRGNPPKDDPALTAFKKWYGENPDPCAAKMTSCLKHHLATLLRQSYERVANEYYRLRRFQGAVIVTTLVVLALAGALITVGARAPEVIPMCFPDPAADVVQPGPGTPACPTGTHSAPTSWDVGTVALFGLLGAALVGVRLVVRRSVPSAVPMTATRWFQALLKAATGMLTAILGLLFLRAGVIPGFSQIDTQSQILVYAIVFGASQELITSFVDRRSNDLLAAVTSTDESAGDRAKSDDE